ncbi:MAG: hypothetical protein ACLTDF_05615 [Coprococcus sp.]
MDACVSAVRKAGYEVFVEPKDIEIQSDPFRQGSRSVMDRLARR